MLLGERPTGMHLITAAEATFTLTTRCHSRTQHEQLEQLLQQEEEKLTNPTTLLYSLNPLIHTANI